MPTPDASRGRTTWIAEVFDGDTLLTSREVPGASARGLAVSFVNRTLRATLAKLGGSVKEVDGELVFVGDGTTEPRPLVLRGRICRGTYVGTSGTVSWTPDFVDGMPLEAFARLRVTPDIQWGAEVAQPAEAAQA